MVKIIDLISAYSLVSNGKGWEKYEKFYPALFRHYFRIWAKRSYPDVSLTLARLEKNAQEIRSRLILIVDAFRRRGFGLDDIEFVLLVGKHTSNGHALKLQDKMVVWLPVETYPTRDLIDVFVTHEIAHALHYQCSPSYGFSGVRGQRKFGRSLMTEGIATYLTTRVLGCSDGYALWAKFLTERQMRDWQHECEIRFSELCKIALRDFDSCRNAVMFRADNRDDILQYRAGYFVGLKVIQQIVAERHLSLNELLSLPRIKLDRSAKKCLLSHAKTL